MVQLYDDRLEISNPGGLLPYVAADFGHRSRSRNPLIFRMFTRMHLVESVGTGIPRIARILSDDGFPPAEYKTEGFFTTILRKKKASSTEQSDHGYPGPTSPLAASPPWCECIDPVHNSLRAYERSNGPFLCPGVDAGPFCSMDRYRCRNGDFPALFR